MQKKAVAKGAEIAVAIVRLGSDPVALKVKKGSTVERVIEAAGLELPDTAQFFVSGVPADLEDVMEDGESLSIVTPKQAGAY